jgi:hypothetical protein
MSVARSGSLLWEIQALLERTYATTGINLEQFLIGKRRWGELAAAAGAREISQTACVFLRVVNGNLFLAVHYAPSLIETLERFDPRRGLSEANIRPFAVFVEEITHAVHAALRFLEHGRVAETESAVRDLELQSRVDCYLVLQLFAARFRVPRRLESAERRWLRHHLFAREQFCYADPALRDRYNEVNFLGRAYAKTLDALTPARRIEEIRRFRPLSYAEKRARILRHNSKA